MNNETIILNELKKRRALLLDPPKYARLQEITGIKGDPKIADLLSRMELKGLIERIGHGDRNIQLKDIDTRHGRRGHGV